MEQFKTNFFFILVDERGLSIKVFRILEILSKEVDAETWDKVSIIKKQTHIKHMSDVA